LGGFDGVEFGPPVVLGIGLATSPGDGKPLCPITNPTDPIISSMNPDTKDIRSRRSIILIKVTIHFRLISK
jgi:hypothetical protein